MLSARRALPVLSFGRFCSSSECIPHFIDTFPYWNYTFNCSTDSAKRKSELRSSPDDGCRWLRESSSTFDLPCRPTTMSSLSPPPLPPRIPSAGRSPTAAPTRPLPASPSPALPARPLPPALPARPVAKRSATASSSRSHKKVVVEEKRIVEAMDNLSLGVLMRRFNKVSPSSLYQTSRRRGKGG